MHMIGTLMDKETIAFWHRIEERFSHSFRIAKSFEDGTLSQPNFLSGDINRMVKEVKEELQKEVKRMPV